MNKKMVKFLLFFSLLFVVFFGNIMPTKAEEIQLGDINAQYTCEYRIWHSGIYPALNKYLYDQTTFTDYDGIDWYKYHDGDIPNLHKINTNLIPEGRFSVYTSLEKDSEYYIASWRRENGNRKLELNQHLSETYEKCPKYIKILYDNGYELSEATKEEFEKSLKYYHFLSNNYETNPFTYNPGIYTEEYLDFDENNKPSANSLKLSDKDKDPSWFRFYAWDQFGAHTVADIVERFYEDESTPLVLSLYDDISIKDRGKVNTDIEESIETYLNVTLNAWNTVINKEEQKMENACGSDWKKYIDRTTYSDSGIEVAANGFIKAINNQTIIIPMTNSATSSLKYDIENNTSAACLIQRNKFMKMWAALYDFTTTIYDDERLLSALKLVDSKQYKSTFLNKLDEFNTRLIQGSANKQEKIENFSDKGSIENAKRHEELEKLQNLRALIASDSTICMGIICPSTKEQYDELKKTDNNYTNCVSIYNSTCKEVKCKTSCKNGGTGCDECVKSCNSSDHTEEFINVFDKKVADNNLLRKSEKYNSYKNISNENNNCLKNLDKKIADLKKEIEKYENDLTKAAFATPQQYDLDFDAYEVQCEDIYFLHEIYVAMIIIAPILLIVMGSIDFTLATVQSDEEKMKKFKQKFPKRILMLLLLILVPLLVTFITKISSSLDGTLFDCVINGL